MARVLAPSLLTAAAAGISGSIVGVFVLLRGEALIALALPQVVAIGAAIGLLMGWPTLPPSLVSVALALLLLVRSRRTSTDYTILPSLFVAGLSISFLIIANSGAHVAELQAVFTGIDVAVSTRQAGVAIPILLIAGAGSGLLWRRWLALSEAPPIAEAAGLNRQKWETIFLVLLAVITLCGTDSLGTVMILAMLFLPSAIVLPWARRVPHALAAAACMAIFLLAIGFVLSVERNFPLSQSVGAVGFATLLVSRFVHWVFQ